MLSSADVSMLPCSHSSEAATTTGRPSAPQEHHESREHTGTVDDPLQGHWKYEKVKDLSSGAFGIVQLGRNKLIAGPENLVAIKFMKADSLSNEEQRKYVEGEVLNHRVLRHPHVIKFEEVFRTRYHIAIVMEYANAGNLFSYVQRAGRLNEVAARWFFQQLMIGLDYCHRRGVVNRDIKLENTLLNMVENLPVPLIKICDFGYSKFHLMSMPKSVVGTLAYMAPEVIMMSGAYDGALADIWSCGVMLFVMLFGQYPFGAPTPPNAQKKGDLAMGQMVDRIIRMKWSIPANITISDECRNLLSKLLISDPAKRMPMAAILTDVWFTVDLPEAALDDNDFFLQQIDERALQPVAEIQAVLNVGTASNQMSSHQMSNVATQMAQ